ncbi:MAG: hypothetical protein ACLR8Y_00165 [Alistipes indistinctus]
MGLLRNREFTGQVFGVLIVEDLFAVVLLVLFSTLYMQKNVEEADIAGRLCKLLFFLVSWFVVAICLIPSLLRRAYGGCSMPRRCWSFRWACASVWSCWPPRSAFRRPSARS